MTAAYANSLPPCGRIHDFADRLLSAMRFEFGGHLEKHAGE